MKKTDIAHDTNLPYFIQRHPNGWAFYNRAYCNTITGIDQGADTDPATVEIPTHVLSKLNGGGEHITDYSTARRIYLHDGSLGLHDGSLGKNSGSLGLHSGSLGKNSGDYFARLFLLTDLGIDPIAQKWFYPLNQKSSNMEL